jgi:NADH-quinone oxidoreductase subunit F
MEKILLKNIDKANSQDIDVYTAGGGYQGLQKALAMKPEDVLGEVKKSRLLGRSGAFPVATKWATTIQESATPKYLVCDADEGEPGCFKDRLILGRDPHLLLEGMIIAAYAIGTGQGYIYIRGEYGNEIQIVKNAITQAVKNNYLGDNILGTGFSFNLTIYKGAGSYVVGEETALLRSMAGLRPSPGARPPYPAQSGYLGKPTVVNNVETLSNIPAIIFNGGDWYSGTGNPEYPGTKLFCLSGSVKRPGVYELPIGVTLRELINEHGNGVKGELKAVLPGGVASGLVDDLDIKMDYKSLAQVNSLLGPGAVIVMNKDVNIIDISIDTLRFFAKESCGKCSVCREGIRAGLMILRRFERNEAKPSDIKLLRNLRRLMYDTANCVLGQAALNTSVSATKLFRDEFESRVRK